MENGAVDFVAEDCDVFALGQVDDFGQQGLRKDGAGRILRVAITCVNLSYWLRRDIV